MSRTAGLFRRGCAAFPGRCPGACGAELRCLLAAGPAAPAATRSSWHARQSRYAASLSSSREAGDDAHGAGEKKKKKGLAGDGNQFLSHMAEKASQPLPRYTLDSLLKMQELSVEDRMHHLSETLHTGISKILLLLMDMPLGFASVDAILAVKRDYVADLRELRACSLDDLQGFHKCIVAINKRHRGTMAQISAACDQFQAETGAGYRPFADLGPTTCAEINEVVPALARLEAQLDMFFEVRTTLRLVIAHCVLLRDFEFGEIDKLHMHELLWPWSMEHGRAPVMLSRFAGDQVPKPRHVGAICLDTRPTRILMEAFSHSQSLCNKEFGCSPELMVNGMHAEEFVEAHEVVETQFPYVDVNLYFIFFEVLKEAMLTSIRKAGPGETPPPVHASLLSGTSLSEEQGRTVKITDTGEGFTRGTARRVWSYFPAPLLMLDGKTQKEASGCWYHRGLGLRVSRVLLEYFGGEIHLHSIYRKGTDVYVYL